MLAAGFEPHSAATAAAAPGRAATLAGRAEAHLPIDAHTVLPEKAETARMPSDRIESEVEARAQALLGYWLAASPDPTRARVLRITDVLFVEDDAALLAGVCGPASAPIWPEAAEIRLRRDADVWHVTVASKDAAPIVLARQADGSWREALAGDGGSTSKLRFVRAALPEIHQYAAQHPLPGLRAGRDSRIELVYIGAHDCSLCRQWESRHLGPNGRPVQSPLWSQIEFTPIRLATLRKPFAIDDAPARLHPVLYDLLAHGVPVRGVPSFLMLVDDQLRARTLGPEAFDSLLLPALRAAVREKLKLP